MPWPVHPTGFFGAQGDQDTYRIERSLRFNSADSAYLNRTPASAGNRKTWTWSGWVKFSSDTDAVIFGSGDGSGADYGAFLKGTNGLQLNVNTSSTNRITAFTASKIRDFSAWYHFVLAVDTTQATNSNGVKIYINGVQQTLTFNVYTQNVDTAFNNTVQHRIGHLLNAVSLYADGYLTEINFIDGQALTPSSFGETDAITGRWKAKAYNGTYGTNGFYLKFADNSGTTATTLGKDSSGNGNNWTPNNFSVTAGSGNDSLVDSPTNYGTDTGVGGEVRGNYCTLNPINTIGANTFSNGNLDVTIANGGTNLVSGTIAFSSGKWYWEVIPTSGADRMIGISDASVSASNASWKTANGWGYYSDGSKYTNNSGSSYGASYATNDVIGVALNMDSGEITFYKNNLSQGIAFNSGISGKTITPMLGNGATSASQGYTVNFGQRPFAYTAPTGFKALCTTNLPTPTIQKPSSYMDVVTWTGDGSSSRTISGLGFSPDLVWMKTRNAGNSHLLYDIVRGASSSGSSKALQTNGTNAEGTINDNSTFGYLDSFNSNGFGLVKGSSGDYTNLSGNTYVAWAWDEAPIAGMDIVSYTGNGTTQNISHSLGVKPAMIIAKQRSASGNDWPVYHKSLTATNYIFLNLTNASATAAANTAWGNNTVTVEPTSSVFTIGSSSGWNVNNTTYIAYLFAEVEGFSKFGSYTSNGSADGPFVWCGFRPKAIWIKKTTGSTNANTGGYIFDSVRGTYNVIGPNLRTDLPDIESTFNALDFTANGFKLRVVDIGVNTSVSGDTYIFAAFAESPFKYSRAR